MVALLCFLSTLLASPFKSKPRLEAENAVLRRQLIILRRKMRGRVRLTNGDRLFLVQLCFPSVLKTIAIVQPETLVRWHRAALQLEIDAGAIQLIGDKALARRMHEWLGLSSFAKEKRQVAELSSLPLARRQSCRL